MQKILDIDLMGLLVPAGSKKDQHGILRNGKSRLRDAPVCTLTDQFVDSLEILSQFPGSFQPGFFTHGVIIPQRSAVVIFLYIEQVCGDFWIINGFIWKYSRRGYWNDEYSGY